MNFTVKHFEALTLTELYEILRARAEIFTVEQKCLCQDMDGLDYKSLHFMLKDGDVVVAYLRAFYLEGCDEPTVKLGRVLTRRHGLGLGRFLMENALAVLAEQMPCEKYIIHAQTQAAGYYAKFGFRVTSDEFMEDGIPHVVMERKAAS
ncbi:MAG: GNAT family N-acetyltransferase [Clostridia bacterium]|nr:GNAT family N-acetyltransferase [Clostridia bacterium]